MANSVMDKFEITDRVCVITGGAGLLGDSHARAVLSGGGIPVLLDISEQRLKEEKDRLTTDFPNGKVEIRLADITDRKELEEVCGSLVEKYGHVDILINNAANNPKVEGNSKNMGA